MQRHSGRRIALAVLCCAASAGAQVTAESPASIVVFPKVVADGSRDTTIHISNSASMSVTLRCWYTNAALTSPNLPPGPGNPPVWQSVMFALGLTHDQPTTWVASRGRLFDSPPSGCAAGGPPFDCTGAGFDPGDVPPLPDGFIGELRCIEIETSGAPISGNHLTGEAAITTLATADVSRYGAIGFLGFDTNNGDASLVLGEEYAGCPQRWLVDHAPDGAPVPGVDVASAIHTTITIASCSMDFDTEIPNTTVVQFLVTNELEQQFSTATTVVGWGSFALGDIAAIFDIGVLTTEGALTVVRPTIDASSRILVLAEEERAVSVGPHSAVAAANVHSDGSATATDIIAIPPQLVE